MTDDQQRVRDRVAEYGGAELAERLVHLERRLAEPAPPEAPPPVPDGGATADFDVAVAGGGLWSLLAPLLASRGLRVAVVERARAGTTHREWNASRAELEQLVALGLVTHSDLERLVVAEYKAGTCRFDGGESYPVLAVLDCAVDADGLLGLARRRGETLGVQYLDGQSVVAHACGARGVRLRVASRGVPRDLVASVMVDARGISSPYAHADLVCPTVGGVLGGLREGPGPRELDPNVGEILATVDGVDRGRQHVWEAFPGRRGEATVYLFYYARRAERTSLLDLYGRFFATLSTYKEGAARMLRPTFGFIPGWSRLTSSKLRPAPRVVVVGDAAALHSPLTYCGFGSMLRTLGTAAETIARAATGEPAAARAGVQDQPIHRLTGALAYLMSSRRFVEGELNQLLDAAFRTLHAMGPVHYAALLRDEMQPRHFVEFLWKTAAEHPAVYTNVLRGMGPALAGRWAYGVARALSPRDLGWGARA